MDADTAADLKAFIAGEGLWDQDALAALVDRLGDESDDVSLRLVVILGSLLERSRSAPVPTRLAADIDGVVYPRLWKILEAVWDELPVSEVRIRVDSLGARLSPWLEPVA